MLTLRNYFRNDQRLDYVAGSGGQLDSGSVNLGKRLVGGIGEMVGVE